MMSTKFKSVLADDIDPAGRARIDALKAALPAATAAAPSRAGRHKGIANDNRGEGEGLYIRVPSETLVALKVQAAQERTTARVLVLRALKDAGLPVPADAIADRRKRND